MLRHRPDLVVSVLLTCDCCVYFGGKFYPVLVSNFGVVGTRFSFKVSPVWLANLDIVNEGSNVVHQLPLVYVDLLCL